MNILVTGALGQLGRSIQEAQDMNFGNTYLYTDIVTGENVSMLDITSEENVDEFVRNNGIDIIVNCAAYTNVDEADTVNGFSDANRLNSLAVRNLAECAKKNNARLIHISTDYVFDGNNNTPYSELDGTAPINAYGFTKLEGEMCATSVLGDDCIVLRTSWLYSPFGKNFVKTMRRLINEEDSINVVIDEVGSPTSAIDLAYAIVKIVNKWNDIPNAGGIYHYSNEGVVSRYDFAEAIRDMEYHIMGNDRAEFVEINPCMTKDLGFELNADRPKYSVMLKDKFKKKFGIGIPYWRSSLLLCMDRIKRDNEKLELDLLGGDELYVDEFDDVDSVTEETPYEHIDEVLKEEK